VSIKKAAYEPLFLWVSCLTKALTTKAPAMNPPDIKKSMANLGEMKCVKLLYGFQC